MSGQLGNNAGIFFKGALIGQQPDYQLGINDVGTGGTTGPSGANASINRGTVLAIDYVTLQPVPDGVWTHVAATYDGSDLRLYVNGTLVDSAPHVGTIFQTGSPLFIGNRFLPSGDIGGFQGLMDDLKIFDRALTAAEVGAPGLPRRRR